MSKLTAPMAAALLAALISAGYLWQQLRAERALTAQRQEQNTSLQDQVAQLELRLQRAAAMVALPTRPPQAAASSAPVPIAAVAEVIPAAVRDRQMLTSAAVNRTRMAVLFPDIEKVLGLTAEESDALAELLRTNPSDAAIEAQLGAKAPQWQEYKVSVEARRRTSELQQMLARSTHPLTDQQVQQLVPTIVTEQQRTAQEALARGPRPTDPRARLDFDEESLKATEARYRRIITASRNFMSTEQVTLMQSSQNRLLATQRANLQVQRAQVEAGGNAAATMSREYLVPADVAGPQVVGGPN